MGDLLSAAVGGASVGWLTLAVMLHLANQVVRGRGWYAILRRTCAGDPALRRRDVLLTWVAGAGAGGVLSARGGDAVRVLLMSHKLPHTRTSTLAGTLVAEAAGDTFVGVVLIVMAVAFGVAPAFGLPGAETAAWAGGVLVVAALLVAIARRMGYGGARRAGRVRGVLAGVAAGCAPLAHPVNYGCTVLPWQVASRVLRGASLSCFLLAFGLPAGVAAIVLVMLAQSGGRVLPLAPASAAAAVGMLTAGFGPATGAAVHASTVAAFMVGMSTILTIAGVAITVTIIAVAWGPGALAAVWHSVRPRRAVQPSEA
jgi:Lysylphosphatidylglycerol synthase TM region